MSDEGFDPCECIWQLSTRYLLSILRQTQDYCTDTECFNISRSSELQGSQESSNFFFTCLIIGFVVLMYVFRPNSLRRLNNHIVKSRDNEPDSRNDPSSPPTAN